MCQPARPRAPVETRWRLTGVGNCRVTGLESGTADWSRELPSHWTDWSRELPRLPSHWSRESTLKSTSKGSSQSRWPGPGTLNTRPVGDGSVITARRPAPGGRVDGDSMAPLEPASEPRSAPRLGDSTQLTVTLAAWLSLPDQCSRQAAQPP